jgi:ADP-glucose pyrophosphorylase
LIRHIQQGWGFLRGEFGEYIELFPAQQRHDEDSWYKGTADAVIGRHCRITKAIIEKGCEVPEGTVIGENKVEDENKYHVSFAGVVLVTPDMLGQKLHVVR